MADTTYSVRVVRKDPDGRTETVEFKGYGLLQELLDDITKAAEERGWLEDDHQEGEPE